MKSDKKRAVKSVMTTLSILPQKNKGEVVKQKQKHIKRTTFKILVLGGEKVGKTSIIRHLLGEEFDVSYTPTIHEQYEKEMIVGDCMMTFELIDTAGLHSFTAMRKYYIEKSDIFLLVFSAQDSGSYEEIERLRKEIEEVKRKHSTELPILVINNKVDDIEITERQDEKTNEQAEAILSWCFSYMVTSTKTGQNMHSVLEYLLSEADFLSKNIDCNQHEVSSHMISGRYLFDEKGGHRSANKTKSKHARAVSYRS